MKYLVSITGLPLSTAPNLVEATQDCGAFVQLSGVLKRHRRQTLQDLQRPSTAVERAALRLGRNQPPSHAGGFVDHAGQGEPGDSGSHESGLLRGLRQRSDGDLRGEAGQLQFNAFEPVIASALFRSFKHLTNACTTLADRCVVGITANPDRLRESIERSISLVTALNPIIGYAAATSVAAEAFAEGTNVRGIVLARGLMTEAELDDALRHEVLTQPRAYERAQRAQ